MSESTYKYDADAIQARKPERPIHPLLLSRTSPREMTGQEVSDDELRVMFEAARWAPSHYNLQPWRFVYAKRNTTHWQPFMDLLWPLNQQWAQTAGALVIVLSNKWWLYKGEKQLIPTHSYDTGAAWISMALEGTARGLVVHGMGGFDYDKAYQLLGVIKDTHNIDAMIAIGKRPAKEDRKQQEAISQRNPIDKFVFEGVFVNNDKI
ncbi:unnamed protein product [Oppiella nova]|uniref:Nitroreductase domain-containing protein n=1 Tax=Oppiella nova TaxID=334625 RepID=A0A7R9QQP1_9ACAR|nr:unnamed protein product [Oppiella nova]CAG2170309.1 unnamed protein product [Oppiella nova]